VPGKQPVVRVRIMDKKDWIAVGTKLLGIYIAVLALIGAGSTVVGTIITLIFFPDHPVSISTLKVIGMILAKMLSGLVAPAVQGAVAWLLLKRTCWCLKKAGFGCEPPQM
jgi:hypothetical protein